MSLAFSAYSLENEDGINNSNSNTNSDSYIDTQQRARRNTTQKRRDAFATKSTKVDSVLEKINASNNNEDDDESDAFSLPQSAGIERMQTKEDEKKKEQESMVNMTSKNEQMFRVLGKPPQPNYENGGNFDLNDYSNYGDNKSNEEYYKRMLPGYLQQQNQQNQSQIMQKNPNNKPYYSQMNYNPVDVTANTDSVLLQKMNYMITLLEDQQDERTNNVTEEVILYSFLGIFIIFIADTFVRVGKYVR
jgi:hypothetical protein